MVNIAAGASIQAAINANPAGTVFNLAAGTWTGQSQLTWKTNIQLIGDPGGGTIIDGGAAVTVFSSDNTTTGVVLQNLTIQNYAPGSPLGAIHGIISAQIIDCIFQNNNYTGLNMGHDTVVTRGRYTSNGVLGIGGFKCNNAQVIGAQIDNNNTTHAAVDNEAGGLKFATADNVKVQNCNVHTNYGPGIWADITCTNWTISGNTVTDNVYQGIQYEISEGTTTISGNTLSGNGLNGPVEGASIFISTSEGCDIFDNTITVPSGADGIVVQCENRGVGFAVSNITIHNNTVVFLGSGGVEGLRQYSGTLGSGNSSNNNQFWVVATGDPHFMWVSPTPAAFATYQGSSGQDAASTLSIGQPSAPPPTGSLAHVQGNVHTTFQSGNTISLSFPAPVGSGNTVVGTATFDQSFGQTLVSITDDKSNTYVIADQINDPDFHQGVATFYAINLTNGPQTISLNLSNDPANNIFSMLLIDEYSGIVSLDQHGMHNLESAGNGANGVSSNGVVTTANGDLIYCTTVNTNAQATTLSAGSNFTVRQLENGGTSACDMGSEERVQAAAGQISGTWTQTLASGASFTTGIMAFKAAANVVNLISTPARLVSVSNTGVLQTFKLAQGQRDVPINPRNFALGTTKLWAKAALAAVRPVWSFTQALILVRQQLAVLPRAFLAGSFTTLAVAQKALAVSSSAAKINFTSLAARAALAINTFNGIFAGPGILHLARAMLHVAPQGAGLNRGLLLFQRRLTWFGQIAIGSAGGLGKRIVEFGHILLGGFGP